MSKSVKKRAKRNRAGEVTGWVWRARYRHPESGKEFMRNFDLKKDAEAWLDQQTSDLVTGEWVDPQSSELTLRQFYLSWSQHQVWEHGTRLAMDLAVKSAPFADIPLRSVTASRSIQPWIKQMDTNGLAPGTVATRFANVRTVLRAACEERRIKRDPTIGVKLPPKRRKDAAMAIPTPTQVSAILECSHPRWRSFFAVAAFVGARLGEVAGLKVENVHFLAREIHLRRQVQRLSGGELEIRLPKCQSERVVPVPDALLEMLSDHVGEFTLGQPDSWLFPNDTLHRPVHQNTVGHQWRQACKRSNVVGYTLHSLRHFYASGLIAAGCDVVTVQRYLGHKTATVTLNTYSHLWPTSDDKARSAVAALIGSVELPAGYQRAT